MMPPEKRKAADDGSQPASEKKVKVSGRAPMQDRVY